MTPEDAGVVEPEDAGPALAVEDGDALLQQLAPTWSADAEFKRWFGALSVRHLVSAAQLVADGKSPRPVLPFLTLTGPFVVREAEGEQLFIAEENAARYDTLINALSSVDAEAAGAAWLRLEPFAEAAFREISRPGARLHDTLQRGVARVLAVEVPEGPLELESRGGVYTFKDPALEARSPLDKQLLRMGARNVKVVQTQLQRFATHAHLN